MSTQCEPPPTTEIERELVRQGERTVDNLKRLFAFVFAISFGVIGIGAIEKLRPILTDPDAPQPSLIDWIINAEMLAVFVITAGVFYHQGTKFLDNRYARHPLTEAHPFGFAWDYLTLVVTMVPFFFMAHAFHPSVTRAVGFTWFFGFYIILLGSGLLLLVLGEIRHSRLVRSILFKEQFHPSEIAREGILRTYWLLMNSCVLFVMLCVFSLFVWTGTPCPTSFRGHETPLFLLIFGGLALARDLLDYRYAWRFLYPLKPDAAQRLDMWPLTRIRDSVRMGQWTVPAYLLIGVSFVLVLQQRLWDIKYWTSACKL